MDQAWAAAAGNLKGWLISLALWATLILLYVGVQMARTPGRTFVRLDPQLAEIIQVKARLQPITGGMDQPGDAADDYNRAVLECIASNNYETILPETRLRELRRPEEFTLGGPDYLLAGAQKEEMHYTSRYTQPVDWFGKRLPHCRAFEQIGRYSVAKARLYARTGQPKEAEKLLKAVMILGYRVDRERVRLQGTYTGLGLQSMAGNALLEVYKDSEQPEKAQAVQEYLAALREALLQIESKARETVGRLNGDTPPTAELIWLVDNDKDRMWRIEAALKLGLTKWTAVRAEDRDASREKLLELQQDPDALVREAAAAGLLVSAEDTHKVR